MRLQIIIQYFAWIFLVFYENLFAGYDFESLQSEKQKSEQLLRTCYLQRCSDFWIIHRIVSAC